EGCTLEGVDPGSCSKDAANRDGGSLLIAARPSRWRYSVETDARPERASADYRLQSFCIYTVVPCDEETCACKIEMGWDTKTFQWPRNSRAGTLGETRRSSRRRSLRAAPHPIRQVFGSRA